MTKTEAVKLARSILSRGYYAHGHSDMDVFYTPTDGKRFRLRLYGKCGRRPSTPEQVAQLSRAILDIAEYGDCSNEVTEPLEG